MMDLPIDDLNIHYYDKKLIKPHSELPWYVFAFINLQIRFDNMIQ